MKFEKEVEGYRLVYNGKKIGGFLDKTLGDIKLLVKDREELVKRLGFSGKKLILGEQTHSSNVRSIKKGDELVEVYRDTDGFLTDRDDIILMTLYADCLPIYLYDPVKKVVGVVHSGWAGSCKAIGKEAVYRAIEDFGSKKEDIKIMLGIGIRGCCYEVGMEFYEKFRKKFDAGVVKRAFTKKGERIYFDNIIFNKELLKDIGITNISEESMCTFCSNGFHSYRKEGKEAGRNGGFIYLG